jgi:hypothetical protein
MRNALITLLLAAAACAAAQTEEQMAEMMKLAEPGEHHKIIGQMAGKWKVDVVYVMNGQEGKGTADMEAKWILGGRWLQMQYESNFMGSPFTVVQHLGYDNVAKEHVEISMNTMATDLMVNRGPCSEGGKTISHKGTYPDIFTKGTMVMRTVYTIKSDDEFTIEWFEKRGDEKEVRAVVLTHKRVK